MNDFILKVNNLSFEYKKTILFLMMSHSQCVRVR